MLDYTEHSSNSTGFFLRACVHNDSDTLTLHVDLCGYFISSRHTGESLDQAFTPRIDIAWIMAWRLLSNPDPWQLSHRLRMSQWPHSDASTLVSCHPIYNCHSTSSQDNKSNLIWLSPSLITQHTQQQPSCQSPQSAWTILSIHSCHSCILQSQCTLLIFCPSSLALKDCSPDLLILISEDETDPISGLFSSKDFYDGQQMSPFEDGKLYLDQLPCIAAAGGKTRPS